MQLPQVECEWAHARRQASARGAYEALRAKRMRASPTTISVVAAAGIAAAASA